MIKGIISLLSLLWILLVGTPAKDEKSTILNKKMSNKEKRMYTKVRFSLWIERNFNFIALAAVLILVMSIIVFMFWAYGVSTVESGTVYYHMKDII